MYNIHIYQVKLRNEATDNNRLRAAWEITEPSLGVKPQEKINSFHL